MVIQQHLEEYGFLTPVQRSPECMFKYVLTNKQLTILLQEVGLFFSPEYMTVPGYLSSFAVHPYLLPFWGQKPVLNHAK